MASLKFVETPLAGAFLIELMPIADERGFFARSWCQDELSSRGLETRIAQCSVSFNARRGTLRGLHYQDAPYEEVKIVRCTQGAMYDVIVDLRVESPTFGRHFAVVLSASNHLQLYIPKRFAHGFQTLEDNTEVTYQISEPYRPEYARGVRWDDLAFGIPWPEVPDRVMSARDRAYPDFQPPISRRST